MALKAELQASFGSLLDALRVGDDPLQPADIVARWASITARCDASARNTAHWNALAPASLSYDPVISAIDGATDAVSNADHANPTSMNSALDETSGALDQLERLLT